MGLRAIRPAQMLDQFASLPSVPLAQEGATDGVVVACEEVATNPERLEQDGCGPSGGIYH